MRKENGRRSGMKSGKNRFLAEVEFYRVRAFYAPITFAAAYGPGWLIAGTWQITIVAGVLLSPFFYETKIHRAGPVSVRQKIPLISLVTSVIILIGAGLIQLQHAGSLSGRTILFSVALGRHRGFCLSARQPQNAGTIRRKTRYVSAGARHDARKPSVLAFDRRFRLA